MRKNNILIMLFTIFIAFFVCMNNSMAKSSGVCCAFHNGHSGKTSYIVKNDKCPEDRGNSWYEKVDDSKCGDDIAEFNKKYGYDTDSFAKPEDAGKFDCTNKNVKRVMVLLGTVLNWIQIIVPVFVVISGIVSLAKAVLSSDDNAVKAATSGLIKKVFIAAAVIFLPMIVFAFMNYVDGFHESTDSGSVVSCIKCIDHPGNC